MASGRDLRALQLAVGGALVLALMLGMATRATARPPSAHELIRSAKPVDVIKARLARYVPVELPVAEARIPASVRAMLPALKQAADHIDRVYWQQMSPDGLELLAVLKKAKSPEAKVLADYLRLHAGVWDRHADDEPFIGHRDRPLGANFYPADLSRRELDVFVARHPDKAKDFWSPYTVIERDGDGLVATPYSKRYAEDLKRAAEALRAAAKAHTCPPGRAGGCPCEGLIKFLEARADSFESDNYRLSELLWVDATTCPIDVVIGPYEVYEDRLLGVKAAFEAFITLRDDADTRYFEVLQAHDQELFDNLPIPATLAPRFERVKPANIAVSDLLYTAGEARVGYQARAILLPNDDVVRRVAGTKGKVFRNVIRAKYDALIKPVSKALFSPETARSLSYEAYFNILLTWQLAHSVVPTEIVLPDRTKTTAQRQLRERYPIIELLKGEVIALLNYFYLANQGHLGAGQDSETAGVTWLASLFDTARLAAATPQTIAKMIAYNYLVQEGAILYYPRTKTFAVDPAQMEPAVRKLAGEVLQILGRGDYDGAGHLIIAYGLMPGEVVAKLDALRKLPIDIRPRFTLR